MEGVESAAETGDVVDAGPVDGSLVADIRWAVVWVCGRQVAVAFDEDRDVGESSEAVGFDLRTGLKLDLDSRTEVLGVSYLHSLIRDIDRTARAVMVS